MNSADDAIRQSILREVEAIDVFDEAESTYQAEITAWIRSGAPLFRIKQPDVPPKHLVAYFVLVDAEHKSILLGDHIKAQLWLPNGGHVEINEHPRDTVRRECPEEVNRPAVFLRGRDRAFFCTTMETVGLTPGHKDMSLWYVLSGDVHDKLVFDRGEFTDMSWFTFDEILESHPAIFNPDMQRFVRKLMRCLDVVQKR